jgi:hypothetical protein
MSKQIILTFNEDGTSTSIYDEAIDFHELGKVSIQRASHVEPTEDGQWTADMSPVGGPVLGPFELRSVALEEEVKWLKRNHLGYVGELN